MVPRPPIQRFGDTPRHPGSVLLVLVLIPAIKLKLGSLVIVRVGRHVDNLDRFDVPQPVPLLGRASLPLAEFQAFLRPCGGRASGTLMARDASHVARSRPLCMAGNRLEKHKPIKSSNPTSRFRARSNLGFRA